MSEPDITNAAPNNKPKGIYTGHVKPFNGSTSDGNITSEVTNYLTPNFDNIPHELKQQKKWLLWIALPREGRKPTKTPVQLNGFNASTTNPNHWQPFDLVKSAYEAAVACGGITYREKGKPPRKMPVAGVGYVFTDNDPDENGYVYIGIDLDSVRANDVSKQRTLSWIKNLASYTEKSVSGSGYHVIVRARPVGNGLKRDNVEVYSTSRYFTVTGNTQGHQPKPIREADAELRELLSEMQVVSPAGITPFGFQYTSLTERLKQAVADTQIESLGAGIEPNNWFDDLNDEDKLHAVRAAAEAIPPAELAIGQEEGIFGWLRLARCVAIVAYKNPHLEASLYEILDDVSQGAPGYYPEGNAKRFEKLVRDAAKPRIDGLTIGSLLSVGRKYGVDYDRWKYAKAAAVSAAVSNSTALVPRIRTEIRPGIYDMDTAIALLNEHYLVSVGEHDNGEIFKILEDGALVHVQLDKFRVATAKVKVRKGTGKDEKVVQASNEWISHSCGNAKAIVFEPGKQVPEREYNLWRGFAVAPSKGRKKIRRLLRHLHKYICNGDHEHFKYLIKWCAWTVQHPDKHTEVMVVLISETQGSGKSTLAQTMRKIFGNHAFALNKKRSLVGDFNEHLERIVFVQAEEALWSGDLSAADTMKDMITSDVASVHPKHRKERQVKNFLNFMICSNHQHAIAAGIRDRRNFVLEVNDAKAGDSKYWDALYGDLKDSGYEEFLGFLQSVKLRVREDGKFIDWHPRKLVKTDAAHNQARMSGDSFIMWMQMSLELGSVAGCQGTASFNAGHSTTLLRNAYEAFCKSNSLRTLGPKGFSQKLMKVCGPRTQVGTGQNRGLGYRLPDEDAVRKEVDALLGIEK